MNARLQSFIREPALIIDFVETFVLMLVAFGVGLSGDTQNYIVAAIVALLGLVKAFTVHPFAVPALTDFARAALVLFASLGVGLSADQIALIVTGLGTLTTIIFTTRTTPISDPVLVEGVVPVGGAMAAPNKRAIAEQLNTGKRRTDRGQYSPMNALIVVLIVVVIIVLLFWLIPGR